MDEDFMISIDKRDPQMIRLMLNEYRLKKLKGDYENMSEMFFGETSSFEEVVSKISSLEKEIYEIPWWYP